MVLPVEPMIPRELTERDGQEALHFAVEAAARSLKILEYQSQSGPERQVHEGFGIQFGQYRGTADSNAELIVPFPTVFPENISCILITGAWVTIRPTRRIFLELVEWNTSQFVVRADANIRGQEYIVHFLAIGF